MIQQFFLAVILFFVVGCSSTPPPNEWQYKSTVAYNSFEKNFLINNIVVAQADLNRAVKHAKMSANLEQLASIYLGECALKLATSVEKPECREYREIAPLVRSKRLSNYYNFLEQQTFDVALLPKDYQKIASLLKQTTKAYKEVLFSIEKPTSLFISAALIQKRLDEEDMQKLIEKASLYGYKRVVLFWLDKLQKTTSNQKLKEESIKKIEILLSSSRVH